MLDYFFAPLDITTTDASVWVGTTANPAADPARVWIEHPPSGGRWPVAAWQPWAAPNGGRSMSYARVQLSGLQPATTYPIELKVDNAFRVRGSVTTLPNALPPVGEPPFTILVGSCFCRLQDESGRVGRAFEHLPDGARPTLKFLVGDQVYLDSPWHRFLLPRSEKSLAEGFLDHYVQTWGQSGDVQGFNHLLCRGANHFCSDDHEFWNNAPFPSSFSVNTWREAGRRTWWKHALDLYQLFQTARSRDIITVGQLSMFTLDTRVNRTADRARFVSAADFAALEAWVADLTSPGILIVGQPIFAKRAGVRGNIFDWNLPDFDQYADLCRVLMASRQSIVVLTGDVHYGRIATVALPSGAELVEVISSPLALVSESAGGRWNPAPDRFPDAAIPGINSLKVTTDATWRRFANHFITIDLNAFGGGLRFAIRAWETEPVEGFLKSAQVAERVLKRIVP